jgi:GGDEF domain-containing protein
MGETTKHKANKLLTEPGSYSGFRFPGLSLVLKIGAGYVAMALFTVVALAVLSVNVYSINKTARGIVNVEFPAISTLVKLRASLLTQESYAGKYAILKDPTFIQLFNQHQKETIANLGLLERTGQTRELAQLKQLYLDYQTASRKLFDGKSRSRAELKSSSQQLLSVLDRYYLKRQEMLQGVLKRAEDQRKSAITRAIAISVAGFGLAILIAPWVTHGIAGALRKLQEATRRIVAGNAEADPQMPVEAELSELAEDVTQMAARLEELELNDDEARPLTRLPGNLAIERVLDERLKSATPFAFCTASLQNFKPLRAHFGYARGGELLCATGVLIYAAVKEQCGEQGFAGHAGGEEFVMMIPTDRAAAVCEAVISSFDAEVVKYVSPQVLEAGGMASRDLLGAQRFFPITTIDIAVITCAPDAYASAAELTSTALELIDSREQTQGSSWSKVSRPTEAS